MPKIKFSYFMYPLTGSPAGYVCLRIGDYWELRIAAVRVHGKNNSWRPASKVAGLYGKRLGMML